MFNRKNELEILDKRVINAQHFNDRIMQENQNLQTELIEERNRLRDQRAELAHDRTLFESEKKTAFEIAEHRYRHLEAELEFIKKHRMLPAECKFFSKEPRKPSVTKRLKKVPKK